MHPDIFEADVNPIHRIIFNRVLGVFQVVSEHARGKGGAGIRLLVLLLAAPQVFAQTIGEGQEVIISGAGDGSTGDYGSPWTVGRLAVNGRLVIEEGGKVFGRSGWVGDRREAPSQPAFVLVTGQGSEWHNSGTGGTNGWLYIGHGADSGDLEIKEGGKVFAEQNIMIGDQNGSDSRVKVGDSGSRLESNERITLGNYGKGALTIRNGGYAKAPYVSVGWGAANGEGEIRLHGTDGARGILETAYIRKGTGRALLEFDGGLLRATRHEADFLRNFSPGDVRVLAGGAFIDTLHGYEVGIHSDRLFADGGLTKLGAGSLDFPNGLVVGDTGVGSLTIEEGGVKAGSGGVVLGRSAGAEGRLVIGAGAGGHPMTHAYLDTEVLSFGDGSGTLVFDENLDDLGPSVFAPDLISEGSGTHAIEHLAGETWLTGDNAGFTGRTTVAGGHLRLGAPGSPGDLGGSVDIQNRAYLSGSGKLGSGPEISTITVASGGAISPGHGSGHGPGSEIGSLIVDGNLMLSEGAELLYDLGEPGETSAAPGVSDHIHVKGDLTLDGEVHLFRRFNDDETLLGYYRLMDYDGDLDDRGLKAVAVDGGFGDPQVLAGNQVVDLLLAPDPEPDPQPDPDPEPDPDPKPQPQPTPKPEPDPAPVPDGDDRLQHWRGGDGVWGDAATHWVNLGGRRATDWAGHHAVFKNPDGGPRGGRVRVEGTQSFQGMQFVDGGFRLEGEGGLLIDGSGSGDNRAEIRVLADRAEIAAGITGEGGIVKTQAGTLLLSGRNSYRGGTLISAGTLLVGDAQGQGSVAGSVDVRGGTLGGSGVVGSGPGSAVKVADGGTLAPGNSIGTLTVDGDLHFAPGSRFEVEVDPAGVGADRLVVTGHARLEGGTVAHIGDQGKYGLRSSYEILSAQGGLSGVFDTVTSRFAFLDPALRYDYETGTVELELVRNDRGFDDEPAPRYALSRNQQATAAAVESLGFDSGHAVHDAVALWPDDESVIRSGFDALSGEIHASLKTALVEDSRLIRQAAKGRLRAAQGAAGASQAQVQLQGQAPVVAHHPGSVIWSQAFGSWGKTDGDGNAAGLDRDTSGLLIGADRALGDGRVGVMAGYSHSKLKAGDRASSATSDSYHLGLYAGAQWDALALRTGAAYGWHDVDAKRSVAMPGLDERLSANGKAKVFQAFGELGYGIEAGRARFEPFASLAHVRLRTDHYAERGGASALAGGGDNTAVTFSTLGVRGEYRLDGVAGGLSLRGTLGWEHAWGDTRPEARHGFVGAANVFSVAGAPIARDAAVIEAGLDLNLGENADLGLSYSGKVAGSSRDHGVKASVMIRF